MTENSMTKAERERVILQFLADSGLALPQKPIYVNLKRDRKITFTQKTLKRRISDLTEKGFVRRLDIGNGYYEITDKGRAYLRADLDADDLD